MRWQSVNEELNTVNTETVNTELAARIEDLHRANADMRNLFESTQVATMFLDPQLLIRSYTPAVTAIFNLIATDRGRPITDIAHNWEIAHNKSHTTWKRSISVARCAA